MAARPKAVFNCDIDVGGIRDKLTRAVDACFVGAISIMAQQLVFRTPVKTGQARGGWNLQLGRGLNSSRNTGRMEVQGGGAFLDPDGHATLEAIRMVLRNRKPKDNVLLYNKVPYIARLENGWSQQAPSGMLTGAHAVLKSMTSKELIAHAEREGLINE